MKTLKMEKNVLELAESINQDLKASKDMGLLKCVQCGMCTSTCPAARHSDYDPREMVKRVLEGDEGVVRDDLIWNCFYCYTCHSVCPVNNSPCLIIQILRQKTIDDGKGLEKVASFLAYGDSFLEFGIGSIPHDFFDNLLEDFGDGWLDLKLNLDDIRGELGLEGYILPEKALCEVKDILGETGFNQRLDRIRRFKNEANTM